MISADKASNLLARAAGAATPPKPAAARRQAPTIVPDPDDKDEYAPITLGGILAASEKLLAVNRGLTPPDDRDHYAHKRVFTPAAFLKERIRLDADRTRRQFAAIVARRRSLGAMPPGAFNGYVDGMLNGNPLALPLEEINPLHLLEQARRLTHFGPGGIGSSDAITPEMQAVHASQFGFISAIEGPESERAGVDVRAAVGAKLGDDGKIYQRFKDRQGRLVWLSPEDTQDMVMKLPD